MDSSEKAVQAAFSRVSTNIAFVIEAVSVVLIALAVLEAVIGACQAILAKIGSVRNSGIIFSRRLAPLLGA